MMYCMPGMFTAVLCGAGAVCIMHILLRGLRLPTILPDRRLFSRSFSSLEVIASAPTLVYLRPGPNGPGFFGLVEIRPRNAKMLEGNFRRIISPNHFMRRITVTVNHAMRRGCRARFSAIASWGVTCRPRRQALLHRALRQQEELTGLTASKPSRGAHTSPNVAVIVTAARRDGRQGVRYRPDVVICSGSMIFDFPVMLVEDSACSHAGVFFWRARLDWRRSF
jgi:hypothetical protein